MNNWNQTTTMENILTEIRKYKLCFYRLLMLVREMASGVNKKAVQPEDGLVYSD